MYHHTSGTLSIQWHASLRRQSRYCGRNAPLPFRKRGVPAAICSLSFDSSLARETKARDSGQRTLTQYQTESKAHPRVPGHAQQCSCGTLWSLAFVKYETGDCHIPISFIRNFGLSLLPSKSQVPLSVSHVISKFSPARISLRYSASTETGCDRSWTERGIRSSVRSK